MATDQPAIVIEGLAKEYRVGFWRRRVEAVLDVSFSVRQGEVFGLVGPNGAGKTTTIKALVGLVKPNRGTIEILGSAAGSREARSKMGFLPENPYFYDHLSASELLRHYGALVGLDRDAITAQTESLLEMVGLADAHEKRISQFSKGMRQRAGIAQALLGDPDLVILDEPQSGLDPIGRREVREIILSLRDQGKTVFFSSHILPDVETVCDRVAVVHQGKTVDVISVDDLSKPGDQEFTVRAKDHGDSEPPAVSGVREVRRRGQELHFILDQRESVDELVQALLERGASILSVEPHATNLEEILMSDIQE